MLLSPDQRQCFSVQVGPWAIEPRWFAQAVAMVKAALAAGGRSPTFGGALLAANVVGEPPMPVSKKPFAMDSSGIAVIEISGPMQKGESKHGGADVLAIRRQLRAAARDPEARGILVVVDSPGGMIAGTDELARDVRLAGEAKPLRAHVDDMAASAALWAISPAERISASPTSEVGSIGVFATVWDDSKKFELEGIKVHVVSTGPFKGAGVPGTEVTEEQLGHVRELVESVNGHFLAAIAEGREMPRRSVEAIADGRMFPAAQARELGLIDKVQSLDEAMESFRAAVRPRQRSAATASAIRLARSRLDTA